MITSTGGSEMSPRPPPNRRRHVSACLLGEISQRAFRCGLYEAQDILVESDDVDLVHLDMTWGAWFKETSLRRPLYHDMSRKLIYAESRAQKGTTHCGLRRIHSGLRRMDRYSLHQRD